MSVTVEVWMLATAFGFGFIAGAAALIYWFIHGAVMGALEEFDEATD